ncbi:hypothetical protein GINT2_001369 [Glugoides intestinalis]
MEKYSKFRDPFIGINPFIQPRQLPITLKMIMLAILRLPIYMFYLLGFPVIGMLISIKKSKLVPSGVIVCNSASEFDKGIIKAAFKIVCFDNLKFKTCVHFPEGTQSNNMTILKYNKEDTSYAIGLRYTTECVYMYGNRLSWLIRFLGSKNVVMVNVIEGNDLSKAAGLPQSILSIEDKEKFMLLLNTQKK